jgi:release factor glutamine methyltransferase
MEKDTILYILNKSKEYLTQKNIPNPRLDVELLLSTELNLERIKLYSNFDKKLSEEQKDSLRDKIKQRGEGKPLSYILNKKSFFKSDFYVDESVLIPRPETEELVEFVLKDIKENQAVLDLGSGSGCIGISLKKEIPSLQIDFSDISSEALEVCKKNFESLLPNENANFFTSDLFDQIPMKKYEWILTNPPYIPIAEKPNLMRDVVDYEPSLALFLEDPKEFNSRLLTSSQNYLKENGKLVMETNPDWIQDLIQLSPYQNFQIVKDLSLKERFIIFS